MAKKSSPGDKGIARGSARDKPITIGCDPEFLILDEDDCIVAADQVLSSSTRDEVGCDGRSDTGELRPKENTNPLKLVDRINRLLSSVSDKINPDYRVVGGSYHGNAPIGGHIHIGHRCLNSGPDLRKVREELARSLDLFCSLPLMFMEDKDSAIERRDCGYGLLSHWRGTEWGIEYRTPPSWLVARRYAKAALCLAYMTTWEYLFVRRGIAFGPAEDFLESHGYNFRKCRKGSLIKIAERAKKKLATFALWRNLGIHTQSIWQNIPQNRTWRCEWDLLRRWPAIESREGEIIPLKYSRDWRCREVAAAVRNPDIYIYGLSDSFSRPDVAYHGDALYDPNILGINSLRGCFTSHNGPSIGLSRYLRGNIDASIAVCHAVINGTHENTEPIRLVREAETS